MQTCMEVIRMQTCMEVIMMQTYMHSYMLRCTTVRPQFLAQ